MKQKKKKQTEKEKPLELLEGMESIQVGDIMLRSGIYSASQLVMIVDGMLKLKRIKEYLKIYDNKKMTNGNSSYLG